MCTSFMVGLPSGSRATRPWTQSPGGRGGWKLGDQIRKEGEHFGEEGSGFSDEIFYLIANAHAITAVLSVRIGTVHIH
jgi:hypothetical protein